MPGDDLYWNPIELDTDDSYGEKDSFIDPWDLENYAYIRNHLDYTELASDPSYPSGSSGEFGEVNSHSFQYVAGSKSPRYMPIPVAKKGYDSLATDQGNYAAIDEVEIYDRRTQSELYVPMSRKKIMDGYISDPEEISPYAEGISKNSVFGIYDERGFFRKVALPVSNHKSPRDRSLSFSYGDHEYNLYGTELDRRPKIYGNPKKESEHFLNEMKTKGKPENFGLSKYGHLKIDYSYSWNNLNKYIRYN